MINTVLVSGNIKVFRKLSTGLSPSPEISSTRAEVLSAWLTTESLQCLEKRLIYRRCSINITRLGKQHRHCPQEVQSPVEEKDT